MAMTLISTITVPNGGYPAVSFTNIPQIFTDLYIQWSARSTASGEDDWTNCSFNGNTTGPTLRQLYGDGSATATGGGSYFELGRENGSGATSNTFGSCMTYIPNYAGSTHKAWSYDSVGENNASKALQFIAAGVWANTAAITSITLAANGNWVEHSSFSLYGITKGSGGATVS